jgi:hypothetical protein
MQNCISGKGIIAGSPEDQLSCLTEPLMSIPSFVLHLPLLFFSFLLKAYHTENLFFLSF